MASENTNNSNDPRSQAMDETIQTDKTVGNIADQSNDAILSVGVEEISIYSIRSKCQCYLILTLGALITSLLAFSDTVYFPALTDIETSLNTTATLVGLSVSMYLLMSGVLSLVWGPVSDRFGRKITMIISLSIFLVASLVCIFTMNIIVLIIFRALEGGSVSATCVIGLSIIADIYPEDNRGTATGFFFIPYSVGPVIGPLVGGPLANAFGWRSTFVFLAAYAAVAIIVTFIFIPETHQYFAKEKFHRANPTKRIIDATPNEKPSFKKPWKPLSYLIDLTAIPYIAVASVTYGSLYCSFTLFSTYISKNPYDYNDTMVGLLFIPSGVSLFIGSVFGGWISDKASKYFEYKKCYTGRLIPGLILSLLTPIGLIVFGWIFQYQLSVVAGITGMVLLSFGQSSLEPAVCAYLTISRQEDAGAVSSANTGCTLLVSGLLVTFAIPMSDSMGPGPYFSFLAALNIIIICLAGILVYKNIRRSNYVQV